ncbi:MAG: DNA-3-methyladenine glycosylase 2 family protein [Clostridia bacterium]|nr:DNA-3-methyladenine glycosylase 2 family protein [Clostridia bacterium]
MKATQHYTKNQISYVYVEDFGIIDISKTFDCGQCFRFEPVFLFGHKHEIGGVAFNKYVVFAQDNNKEIYVYNTTLEEFNELWCEFLSLDKDYEKMDKAIFDAIPTKHTSLSIECGKGIRILKQDKWEALCSFIISQNNNIPRIKKIISSLCKKYGESVCFLDKIDYTFPSYTQVLEAGVDALFELKTGFRAKYIYDCALKLSSKEIDLDEISTLSLENALNELYKVKGIGLKVGSCALLFGFGFGNAFPVDVHMKRTLEKYYPDGVDIDRLGMNAGLFQQYLFFYEKYMQST